jgi:hypothetical protein
MTIHDDVWTAESDAWGLDRLAWEDDGTDCRSTQASLPRRSATDATESVDPLQKRGGRRGALLGAPTNGEHLVTSSCVGEAGVERCADALGARILPG